MTTPASLTASALTVAPGAFGRVLVGAKAEECRLTQLPVRGPLGVRKLSDELGSHPRRVAHPRRGIERRLIRPQLLELRRKHRQRVLGEPGAHLADVAKLRTVVEANEKGAEVLAAPLRRRGPTHP